MFNKNKRRLEKLVQVFSSDFEIEKSTIWYFIAEELERLYKTNAKPQTIDLKIIKREYEKKQKDFEKDLTTKKQEIETQNKVLEANYSEQLQKIDYSITQLEQKKVSLNGKIELKTQEKDNIENIIAELLDDIESKNSQLKELKGKQIRHQELSKKITKEIKIKEYDNMMNSHKEKEENDKSHKLLKYFITGITIAGVIIALIFIYNKK